jgi:Na+/H+ antiporter NhaD/arsenite permease-like protein
LPLGEVGFLGFRVPGEDVLREGGIVLMAVLSLATTRRALREENRFSWEPIREVAILFAAIFVTMIPALEILKAGERGQLAFLIRAVREPWQYFWAVGALSSFLDNAPTYLTFFTLQLSRLYPGMPEAVAVPRLLAEHSLMLQAVSAGAVFMGANTYIGNAPNFMIRSIAEEAGIAMPSFLGYMFRWSVPILIPLFALAGLLFY